MKLINKIKNYSAKKAIIPLAALALATGYQSQAQNRGEIEKAANTTAKFIIGLESLFGNNQQSNNQSKTEDTYYTQDMDIDGDGDLDYLEV